VRKRAVPTPQIARATEIGFAISVLFFTSLSPMAPRKGIAYSRPRLESEA